MHMEPVWAIVTVGAITKGVELAIETMAASLPSPIAGKAKAWSARKAIRSAASRIDQVRMVKTIWQTDKAVDLLDFYYPSKLNVSDAQVRVSRLEDIPFKGNLVVQGTVGQGKSIFLRYLTVVEAVDGQRVPLFVELRRIRTDETLMDHVLGELGSLGFPTDADLFDCVASTGQLILLLDAFDEVREERRASLVHELEVLARRHSQLRIIITARPGCGIQESPFWRVVELAPLTKVDHELILRRVCLEPQMADSIVSGLNSSSGNISTLLTTPLMVALLVLRFRAEQSLPDSYAAFFSGLFDLLLLRHDKTKAGFVRERRSKVGDKALERVFMLICFLTRKLGASAFSRQTIYDIATEALTNTGIVAAADDVLLDIQAVTCLLLEEGGEYRFIHKSIQEFHAASFIAHETEAAVTKFYEAMHSRWTSWQQELGFLQTLDTYRYLKLFALRMFDILFGPALNTHEQLLEVMVVSMDLNDDKSISVSPGTLLSPEFPAAAFAVIQAYRSGFKIAPLIPVEELQRWCGGPEELLEGRHGPLSFSELIRHGVATDSLNAAARAMMRHIEQERSNSIAIVAAMDARQGLMSF